MQIIQGIIRIMEAIPIRVNKVSCLNIRAVAIRDKPARYKIKLVVRSRGFIKCVYCLTNIPNLRYLFCFKVFKIKQMSGKYCWTGICLALSISICAQSRMKPQVKVLADEFIFNEAPFAQCHASTLAGLPDGNLLVAWFGGSYEGSSDVCIWSAEYQHQQWKNPQRLVCGISSSGEPLPCWNPVLFPVSGDTLILYYKQGPNPREWETWKILSYDMGDSWSAPEKLNGYLGPVKNKPFVTTSGTWLNPSSTETDSRWQIFMDRSEDQGKTWVVIPVDTANPAKVIQPALLGYKDGRIQALCRSNQNCIMESWSADDGKSWSPLQATNIRNPNSGLDALTLSTGLHVLVLNPAQAGKEWYEGRNQLSVFWSRDGKDWNFLLDLENQSSGEYSYPAVIETSDGLIHVTYTHNRTKIRHVAFIINW